MGDLEGTSSDAKSAVSAVQSIASARRAPGPAAFGSSASGNVLLAPEEVILDASCAYDALARHAVMRNRSALTKVQADIVMSLALLGEMSMTELAHNLAVSKEHVSRAVSALCDSGLVEKRRSEDNFRVVNARLTAAGTERALAIRKATVECLQQPLSVLSNDERHELMEISQRAIELLDKVRVD